MRSMRAWKLVAVLVAVMLVGTFVISGVASGKSTKTSTFTLVVIPVTTDVPIERGFTFTDRLETTDGEPIEGWDGGRCINLNPDLEDLSQWMCELVVHLPEGDLTLAGPFDLGGVFAGEADIVFAVTGGTGQFRNARGEMELVPVPDAPDGRGLAAFRLIGASANY